ncbi:MAG: YaaR family protein [Lachnospiraceae bacterium]|nr:YaaR family protein [Lachnospiraceae bacterium]
MDLKITPMQQFQQIEQNIQTPETDSSFKFTLLSTLEENELQASLSLMMQDITQQGKLLGKRMDLRDMKTYRRLIKEFMNEIAGNSHKFSRENFLDRKGRHRVYGIVKQINQTLDELAAELLKEEKDNIAILSKIDEIRGLLLDIFT